MSNLRRWPNDIGLKPVCEARIERHERSVCSSMVPGQNRDRSMIAVRSLPCVTLLCGLCLPPALAADEPKFAPLLQSAVDNHTLAGAVLLVADKDRTLTLETVGYADVGAQKPMRADNLFWIASQSKPITAAALMILVDEGKVKLDDPVEKYLPEFKGLWLATERDTNHVLLKRPSHPITVRNVLSHTSGLPFKSELEEPTLDLFPLEARVRSYAMTPLDFDPDSGYRYSNAGINTAGRIIEVVSGMSYEEFLDKRLFEPLGMKDTTFWPNEEQLRRLAKSYKPAVEGGLEEIKIGQLRYPLDDRQRQPMPAGGLFSTAGDVARFCRMVLSGGAFEGKRYLSEEAAREMTKRQTPETVKESYGLGWSTGGGVFGHGGAFTTNMSVDSGRGLITVYMVQHAGPPEVGQLYGVFAKAAQEAFSK
jgi:CubicO group peptidase (beta-lactamase class C family)